MIVDVEREERYWYPDDGGIVWLAAQKASSHSNKRLRRSVWVREGGRWRDVSKLEMEAGLAL